MYFIQIINTGRINKILGISSEILGKIDEIIPNCSLNTFFPNSSNEKDIKIEEITDRYLYFGEEGEFRKLTTVNK